MVRVFVSLFVTLLVTVQSNLVTAQTEPTKEIEAQNAAAQIAYLESQKEWEQIYDLFHPYAAMTVPRDAVVAWYEERFGKLEIERASVESIEELRGYHYPLLGRSSVEDAYVATVRYEIKDHADEFGLIYVGETAGLGWRNLFGVDADWIRGIVNTYSLGYEFPETGGLQGRSLDQKWTSTDGTISYAFQAPWLATTMALNPTIRRTRFDPGYDSFRTEFFEIETRGTDACERLYESACSDFLNRKLLELQDAMFPAFSSFDVVQGWSFFGSQPFPRVVTAADVAGAEWFFTMSLQKVSEGSLLVRFDMHQGSSRFDVSPIDALYLWTTLQRQ